MLLIIVKDELSPFKGKITAQLKTEKHLPSLKDKLYALKKQMEEQCSFILTYKSKRSKNFKIIFKNLLNNLVLSNISIILVVLTINITITIVIVKIKF